MHILSLGQQNDVLVEVCSFLLIFDRGHLLSIVNLLLVFSWRPAPLLRSGASNVLGSSSSSSSSSNESLLFFTVFYSFDFRAIRSSPSKCDAENDGGAKQLF